MLGTSCFPSLQVELKLRKREMIQWSSLEDKGEDKAPLTVSNTVPTNEDVHKYPSSAHYSRNWDKIVADVKKEEKDEKPEGDAALNKLFQQIYADGSDEVKKAMNKSFVSKVLNTSCSTVYIAVCIPLPSNQILISKYQASGGVVVSVGWGNGSG